MILLNISDTESDLNTKSTIRENSMDQLIDFLN